MDRSRFALLLILVVGAAVRLVALGSEGLWVDESITIWFIRELSYGGLVWTLPRWNPHLPLFYLLVEAWIDVVGIAPPAEAPARTVSALAGTALIGVGHLLGVEVADRRTGLLTALLLALSPHVVYHSRVARMYVLFGLFVTLTWWLALRYHRAPTRARAVGLVLSALASVYTHYFGVLFAGVALAWLLVEDLRDRRRWALASVVGVASLPGVAAIALKLLGRAGSAAQVHHVVRPPTASAILVQLPIRWIVQHKFPIPGAPAWASILVLSVPIIAISRSFIRGLRVTEHRRPLLLWLCGPIVVVVAVSWLAKPVYQPRYVLPAAVPFILLAGRGIASLGSRRALVVALVLSSTLAVPLGIQTASPQHQEFDEAADWLLERADADDVIVVGDARPESPHTYYLEGFEGEVIGAEQARFIDERDVWIIYEPGVDGDRRRVRNALGDSYEIVESEEWHLVRVEHYRRR